MIHPSYTELMEVVNEENIEDGEQPVVKSRYSIVMATAKRARQIAQGAHVYTAHEESSPVATAVWEIEEGKVKAVEEDVEENTTEEKSDKEENSEEEE